MRLPRPKFRLRTLMVLVAVVAVALGADRVRRRWRLFRERAEFHASGEAHASRILELHTYDAAHWRAKAFAARSAGLEKQATDWDELGVTFERQAAGWREHLTDHTRLKRYYQQKW